MDEEGIKREIQGIGMKLLEKIFLWGLLLMLGAMVIGGIWIATIDLNDYKEWIGKRFLDASGKELRIDGRIDHGFYPWLEIDLSGISIADPGEAAKMSLDAKRLRLSVKTLPLLLGRTVEIGAFEADSLCVKLRMQDRLEGSVLPETGTEIRQEQEESEDKGDSFFDISSLKLGKLSIKGACLHIDNVSTGNHFALDDIDIEIGAWQFGEPVNLKASTRVSNSIPALQGSVALEGRAEYGEDGQQLDFSVMGMGDFTGDVLPGGKAKAKLDTRIAIDLEEQSVVLEDVDLEIMGLVAQGNARMKGGSDGEAAAAQISLRVSSKDIAVPVAAMGKEALAAQIRKLPDRSMQAQIELNVDADGHAILKPLQLSALGAEVHMEMEAVGGEDWENLVSKGKIQAKGASLPLLMDLASVVLPKDAAYSAYLRKLSKLRQPAQFKIDAAWDVDFPANRLVVKPLKSTMLGVQISGDVRNASNGGLQGSISVQSKNIAAIAKALGLSDAAQNIHGMDLELPFSGDLKSMRFAPLSLQIMISSPHIKGDAAQIDLRAGVELRISEHTVHLRDMTVSGMGLMLQANANVEKFIADPKIAGDFSLAPFDLRNFSRKVGIALPSTAKASALSKLALPKQNFSFGSGGMELPKLQMQLDGSKISGSLKSRRAVASAPWAHEIELHVDRIDLNDYLPPRSQAASSPRKAVATAGESEGDTDAILETLRGLDIDAHLNMDELLVSGVQLREVNLTLKAQGGQLRAAPVRAQLYGGQYSGDVELNLRGKTPMLRVQSNLKGSDIEQLLVALTGSAQVSGRGTVELDLRASGQNISVLRDQLSGTGKLELADGVLRGVDVSGILRQLETLIRERRIADVNAGKQTSFKVAKATLNIQQGVVRSDEFILQTGDVHVSGTGILADLRNQTWDYLFSIKTDEHVSDGKGKMLGGHHIKVRCQGKIKDKRCLPDVEKLLQSILQKYIKERGVELLKDKLSEKLGSKIGDALLGGSKKKQEAPPAPAQNPPREAPKQVDPVEKLKEQGLEKLLEKLF
ncbi:MAG: AsmA family protein [Candidatus Eutrophobiaceae bacterium]